MIIILDFTCMAAPSAITEQQMAEVAFMAGLIRGDDESQRHTHLDMTVASAVCENTSSAGGGGIQVGSGDLKIEDGADISSNTAVSGGGIQVGSASHFTMSGGSVSYNEAVIGEKTSLAVAFTLVTVRTISLASPAERSRTTAQRTLAAASRSQQVLPCLLPTVPFKEIPVGP